MFCMLSDGALHICENISNGIRVMEFTRNYVKNGYVQCSKSNNSKIRKIRVTVHMFCMSSHGALHIYMGESKYKK